MKRAMDCDRCGSAGSIQFNMCQVCLKVYEDDDNRAAGSRGSRLSTAVDVINRAEIKVRPPAFLQATQLS